MTPSLLSSLLELNAVLVSDVINALVKKHLVHKIKILPDKRSFMINATAEGKITAIEASSCGTGQQEILLAWSTPTKFSNYSLQNNFCDRVNF